MKITSPELRTFNDWSNDGFKILKGTKSAQRNAQGIPLFSAEQVTKTGCTYIGQGEDGDEEDFDPDLPGNPADYGCS